VLPDAAAGLTAGDAGTLPERGAEEALGSIAGATVWVNAASGNIIKINKIQRNNR
jgi:hypothetical protein